MWGTQRQCSADTVSCSRNGLQWTTVCYWSRVIVPHLRIKPTVMMHSTPTPPHHTTAVSSANGKTLLLFDIPTSNIKAVSVSIEEQFLFWIGSSFASSIVVVIRLSDQQFENVKVMESQTSYILYIDLAACLTDDLFCLFLKKNCCGFTQISYICLGNTKGLSIDLPPSVELLSLPTDWQGWTFLPVFRWRRMYCAAVLPEHHSGF